MPGDALVDRPDDNSDVAAPSQSIYMGKFRGLPISGVVIAAVCILAVFAVASIYAVGYEVARRNTAELARDKSEILIHSIQERVRSHLDPVREQLEYLSVLIENKRIGLDQQDRLESLLIGSLAAAPQVSVVAFIDPNLQILRGFRYRTDDPFKVSDWSDDPSLSRTIAKASGVDGAFWGELFVAEEAGLTFINLVMPIYYEMQFAGALIAGVSIYDLSEFLALLTGKYADNAFILYGKDHVLAHPLLLEALPEVSDAHPLPNLQEFGDPVLSHIWDPNRQEEVETNFVNEIEARVVEIGGDSYVFLYRRILGFGERPWTIGTYFRLKDIAPQLARLRYIPQIGVAVLVVVLALGVLLSAGLSRTIRRLATVAKQIRFLNFDRVPRIPRGVFRELNDAADAFNAMIEGLRLFEMYVPRSHVRRLIRYKKEDSFASRECEATILFTDVVGFTSIAESLPASEVAEILNHHFALVYKCVEAEDGILDKYIGDSVMAFWGGVEPMRDHAERACRASIGISQAIQRDNARRSDAGLPPLKLRIGIHSGRVIIGNVGAPGRINYTVIGDVVNTAERLEALSRNLADESEEVFTVVSADTAKHLGPDFSLVPLGEHDVRGRHGRIEVYCLRNN